MPGAHLCPFSIHCNNIKISEILATRNIQFNSCILSHINEISKYFSVFAPSCKVKIALQMILRIDSESSKLFEKERNDGLYGFRFGIFAGVMEGRPSFQRLVIGIGSVEHK